MEPYFKSLVPLLLILVAIELALPCLWSFAKRKRQVRLSSISADSMLPFLERATQEESKNGKGFESLAARAMERGLVRDSRAYAALAEGSKVHLCLLDRLVEIALGDENAFIVPMPSENDSSVDLFALIAQSEFLVEDVYRLCLREARVLGRSDLGKTVKVLLRSEEDRLRLMKMMTSGDIGEECSESVFVCPGCGRAEIGVASAFCPVCNTPNFRLKKIDFSEPEDTKAASLA